MQIMKIDTLRQTIQKLNDAKFTAKSIDLAENDYKALRTLVKNGEISVVENEDQHVGKVYQATPKLKETIDRRSNSRNIIVNYNEEIMNRIKYAIHLLKGSPFSAQTLDTVHNYSYGTKTKILKELLNRGDIVLHHKEEFTNYYVQTVAMRINDIAKYREEYKEITRNDQVFLKHFPQYNGRLRARHVHIGR